MKYLFLLATLSMTSCSTIVDSRDGCSNTIACTEVYKSIVLTIKDQEGKPYALDEYATTKLSTGEKVLIRAAAGNEQIIKTGQYPVFEDGNMPLTSQEGQEFEFTGSRDGKVVIRKSFTISHDCCHVVLQKGETSTVIDL
jgi:hypothetical protein